MSNIDQAIRELDEIEAEYRNERQIWWVDNVLTVVYILLWIGLYRSPLKDYILPFSSIWLVPFSIFVYSMALGSIFIALHLLLFRLRRPVALLAALKALTITSSVLSIVLWLLILAASKTADLLF